MKKRNLLSSIISLFFTCFLLITCILAWYTNNKNVSANGIIGSSAGDSITIELERGIFNEGQWSWDTANELSFLNISPGNNFYFRMKLDNISKEDAPLTIEFDEINSFLNDNVAVYDGYVCLYQEPYYIPLYEIVDNTVLLDDKTLYNISSNVISLEDYKIEDVFYFYNLGTSEPINNKLLDSNGSLLNGTKLTELNKVSVDAEANETTYFYFALEFNDEESLVEINGINCSNAYAYQSLSISSIKVQA